MNASNSPTVLQSVPFIQRSKVGARLTFKTVTVTGLSAGASYDSALLSVSSKRVAQ